ncbi:MAG: DUF2277 domain-containing protein [Chloroflexi bacterium]|nr:DUF2277 domain-containing protein [Chloroflexota bacterium]
MCRNIHRLRYIDRTATQEEYLAAARQYVRKVSGFREPSRANHEAFERAVAEIARSTQELMDGLVVRGV